MIPRHFRFIGSARPRRYGTSTVRRIFAAAMVVASATAIVSLLSTGREILVAATFGTGDAIEAYLIAFIVPTVAVNVIAGSFGSALVPTFIQVRERDGPEAAQDVFSAGMVLGIGLLFAVTGVLTIASPFVLPILAGGFDPDKLLLTQRLLIILLPMVVLNGLAIMWSAILNAGERFALAGLAPAAVPIISMAALILGRGWGIYALAAGLITGIGAQLWILGRGLASEGVSTRLHWPGANPDIRRVVAQYTPLVGGVAILSSTLLVDQAVAARLGPGSVAALAYGTKVVALMTSLGAGALGTVALPYFAKMVAHADWAGVRHTLRVYSGLTFLASIPLTLVLFIFSGPIVTVVFQRGAFTASDAALVAQIQALYALQIPFYVLGILYARALSSLGANRVLLWSTAVTVPINAVLDIALARMLGVAGIALATSIMYVAGCAFLAAMLSRVLKTAAHPVSHDETNHFRAEQIT